MSYRLFVPRPPGSGFPSWPKSSSPYPEPRKDHHLDPGNANNPGASKKFPLKEHDGKNPGDRRATLHPGYFCSKSRVLTRPCWMKKDVPCFPWEEIWVSLTYHGWVLPGWLLGALLSPHWRITVLATLIMASYDIAQVFGCNWES